jgi:hypothetical protein
MWRSHVSGSGFSSDGESYTVTEGRAECFDDHFPCRRKGRNLQYVRRLLNPYQLLSRPENQRTVQNIIRMIGMA